MKAFLDPDAGLSQAMFRIARALARHAPDDVTGAASEAEADLVLLHVIGHPETLERTRRLRANGQRYAIAQYCLRTSQRPDTRDWLEIWRGAEVVWTYYDLLRLAAADGVGLDGVEVYWSPLGCDAAVFRTPVLHPDLPRRYAIATSGYVAETEGTTEAAEAARRVGAETFHLGPDLGLGPHVTSLTGIRDAELAWMYSQCRYVAGLRRVEGFEMPAVEGLLCGARPVVFNAPHYSAWYGDMAEYIDEGSPSEVTDALECLFRTEPRPVSLEERAAAAAKFDWASISSGFWERCLRYV